MNVDASVASENWEKLLSRIHDEGHDEGNGSYLTIKLSDSEAVLYDFANEVLMRRMRERLVGAIRREARVRFRLFCLTFGNKFFMTANEQEQRSFFQSIFNLPGESNTSIFVGEATDNHTESPAITIKTSALLDALPQLNRNVRHLFISNFALTCQSDVQAMSNFILAKKRDKFVFRDVPDDEKMKCLQTLGLESIKCPLDDCIKQDSDEPNGFLDPVLHAASGVNKFALSAKTCSFHSALVSPMAVRALFVEGKKSKSLSLRGFCLTDSHVLAIVDGLSTPGTHLDHLTLGSSPGITAQGYEALLNLINRTNVIGKSFHPYEARLPIQWYGFSLDDKAWEGKLNLVSEMNSRFSRLKYLTNGSFSSEERRWQWLEKVVDFPMFENEDEEYEDEDEDEDDGYISQRFEEEIDYPKRVNFIWHLLRENPEMMRTEHD